ncbi:hypothetical protein SK128_002430, partial [Halocaridina rubra]
QPAYYAGKTPRLPFFLCATDRPIFKSAYRELTSAYIEDRIFRYFHETWNLH